MIFAGRHEPLVGMGVCERRIHPRRPGAGNALGRWEGRLWSRSWAVFGKQGPGLEGYGSQKRGAWGGPGIYLTRWLAQARWDPGSIWPAARPAIRGADFCSGNISPVRSRGRFSYLIGAISSSDRVMALYGVLGDLTWAIAALLVTIILGVQTAGVCAGGVRLAGEVVWPTPYNKDPGSRNCARFSSFGLVIGDGGMGANYRSECRDMLAEPSQLRLG